MAKTDYAALDRELCAVLKLGVPPIGIAFRAEAPADIARPGGTVPPATADGRTGAVSAGCVFWMRATETEFATVAADHGNCSVGSLTHGFKSLAEAGGGADVAALVASEWVSPNDFGSIPTVTTKPGAVVYGPLATSTVEPDVILLRLNGKQLMQIYGAVPGLKLEGRPQCHIIPMAKEAGEIAVSSGCMLSRVRTGMSNNEVTCAIPAPRLAELISRLEATLAADLAVASYASEDAKRFA